MQTLKEKTWAAISLNSIFTFERGKEKNMASLIEGDIPLVSARKINNGIKGFVGNPAKVIKGGEIISLNNDGDGGAGLAFYQPFNFALDTHVTALHPKYKISPEALIYMTVSISKQHSVFGHGRSISLPRAQRIQDVLPITNTGEPDYEYMEQYVATRKRILLSRYKKFIAKQRSELEHKDVPELREKEWKEFSLSDIFTVDSGKRLETRNKLPGVRPFIGATDNGNGVTGFVGNNNTSKDYNVLGVNYNGAPCIAFYHPYECIFTDDVKRLHLRGHSDNKYILLFFVSVFAQQRAKFSYGYKFNEQRMLRQKLMLPVNDSGEPDFEFMEQYAKNMVLRKYDQYISFSGR